MTVRCDEGQEVTPRRERCGPARGVEGRGGRPLGSLQGWGVRAAAPSRRVSSPVVDAL